MSGKEYQRCGLSVISVITVILLLFTPVRCQVARQSKTKKKAPARPEAEIARWQSLLDDLAQEAKTFL